MNKDIRRCSDEIEKDFLKQFDVLRRNLNSWQAWEYMVSAIACMVADIGDPNEARRAERKKEYEHSLEQLNGDRDTVARLFDIILEHFREYPEEDFLGKMYMALDLGNHWSGQFFTPWNVSLMMAMMTMPDSLDGEIRRKGYASVTDPTCGAGVNLLAAARVVKDRGTDYRDSILFVGQDLDRVVAQMCYIQLSLIDAAGYVCVANTLANPITGISDLVPCERDGQDYWYTPAYWSDKWQKRVLEQTLVFLGSRTEAADGQSA